MGKFQMWQTGISGVPVKLYDGSQEVSRFVVLDLRLTEPQIPVPKGRLTEL